MRITTARLAALSLYALAFGAMAQQPYLVGSLGHSNWSYDCGPGGCQRGSTAWRVGVGYRFNRLVAVEGFYVDFGRARSSDYYTDGTLGATGAGVQALLGWQIGAVDLAGKIGLVGMRNDFRAAATSSYTSTTVHRTEVIGGLMGAYRLTPNLALRLDADILTVALEGDALYYARGSDVVTFSLGLMWQF